MIFKLSRVNNLLTKWLTSERERICICMVWLQRPDSEPSKILKLHYHRWGVGASKKISGFQFSTFPLKLFVLFFPLYWVNDFVSCLIPYLSVKCQCSLKSWFSLFTLDQQQFLLRIRQHSELKPPKICTVAQANLCFRRIQLF